MRDKDLAPCFRYFEQMQETLRDCSAVDDWDRHWADFEETSAQSPATRYRTQLLLKLLRLHAAGPPVHLLEIGSGTGQFARDVLVHFPDVSFTGLEVSARGVAAARRNAPCAQFLQRDLMLPVGHHQIPRPLATHAVCSEVLEHLDQPADLLRNAASYLADQCLLIVTVPGGPMSEFYRHIGHRRHYTSRSLRQLLESSGFTVDQVLAPGFPFYNLFRLMLTLRGSRLVSDVARPAADTPWHVRLGVRLFDFLFHFNVNRGGWQLIALARPRRESTSAG